MTTLKVLLVIFGFFILFASQAVAATEVTCRSSPVNKVGNARLTLDTNGQWCVRRAYTLYYRTDLGERPEFERYLQAAVDEWNGQTVIRLVKTADPNQADFSVVFADIPPNSNYSSPVLGDADPSYGLRYNRLSIDKGNEDPDPAAFWATVTLHELGHALGIDHPVDPQRGPDGKAFLPFYVDVMDGIARFSDDPCEQYNPPPICRHLSDSTIELVRQAYGNAGIAEPIPPDPPWTPPPSNSSTATNSDSSAVPTGTKRIRYKWRKGKRRFRYKCRGCVRIVRPR